MQSAWVGKSCRQDIHADIFFLLLLSKSGKNMLMKDTTHYRLTGFGIYSLLTIFYAKIINIQLDKAVFILKIQTRLLHHFQVTREHVIRYLLEIEQNTHLFFIGCKRFIRRP